MTLKHTLTNKQHVTETNIKRQTINTIENAYITNNPTRRGRSITRVHPLFKQGAKNSFLLSFRKVKIYKPPVQPPARSSNCTRRVHVSQRSKSVRHITRRSIHNFTTSPQRTNRFVRHTQRRTTRSFIRYHNRSSRVLNFQAVRPRQVGSIFSLNQIYNHRIANNKMNNRRFQNSHISALINNLNTRRNNSRRFRQVQRVRYTDKYQGRLTRGIMFIVRTHRAHKFNFSRHVSLDNMVSVVSDLRHH